MYVVKLNRNLFTTIIKPSLTRCILARFRAYRDDKQAKRDMALIYLGCAIKQTGIHGLNKRFQI